MRISSDNEAVIVAQERVIHAVLRVLGAERLNPGDPFADAESDLAGDELALAARELAQAVDSADADDQPVGWNSNPEGWDA